MILLRLDLYRLIQITTYIFSLEFFASFHISLEFFKFLFRAGFWINIMKISNSNISFKFNSYTYVLTSYRSRDILATSSALEGAPLAYYSISVKNAVNDG